MSSDLQLTRRTPSAASLTIRCFVVLLVGLVGASARVALAATPASGTVTPVTTSVAWTGTIFGANVDETTCTDGTTCDVYTLTLAPGNYTGKTLDVSISWVVPVNDYDLYVHSGTASGTVVAQSANGAPGTSELAHISIEPPVVATERTYIVHVVAFSVVPASVYNGSASLVASTAPRQPIYQAGGLRFSQNVTVRAPVASADGEPSLRVDVRGNCYVGGIRGVPAGVDLWRFDLNPASPTFDPGLNSPTYLGQPDAFLPQDPDDPTTGGADGGGDIDIACSFPTHPDSTPVVTIVSLAAAEISSAVSTNRGANFTLSPAVALLPSDDRQWIECDGPNTVYMLYRAPIPATGLFVQRSDDHGLTYPVTGLVSPSGTTPGYIDVDHTSGRVYVSHTSSSALTVGYSTDQGATWSNNTVDNSTSHGSLFDVVKVGTDGTAYAVWSDEINIYLAHSTNGGVTWSPKVRINDNALYKTNLFPWIEAGSAGRVAVVWFASRSAVNDDSADWDVLFTQTLDATAFNPTFRQQVISDHVIHGSNISLGGLSPTGGANRNLIDYFQIALDPQGAAVVAFADDHNDFDGHTYLTRQLDGFSLYATANGNGQVNSAFPVGPPDPGPAAPEVSDFLHDAVVGLLQPIPQDNPYDILWIDYSCSASATDDTLIATMKVSDLATVPPATTWRVNLTANAPGGVSDNGDQFYLQANSQNPATPTFTFGTAVRDPDGGLTYTSRGTCTGSLNTVDDTVVLRVLTSQLDPFMTVGPPLVPGAVLYGLRGSTFTSGANAVRDDTRGGTFLRLCGAISAVPVTPVTGPVAEFLGGPRPNPTNGVSMIEFQMARPGFAELAVFDVAGRRVRTISAGNIDAGRHEKTWDGRTDRFETAPAGIYFFVLNTSSGIESRRIVRTR